ncbi:uncharacterized protein EDB91DRAFT_643550 [Suillus paluster]|uniref:uncharacterized protein n=1 Tax=Suillus paluster TaxID=48578 RepID=UPI001B880C1B|nr:uncharacterized protein EDB91DRAFT_643550 [Suillus paluster]KAG1733377.1 hypothetical protein EDB91DRAFT_643550 [Suillus paluster]
MQVIMIARLHAIYQQSRTIFMSLIIASLAVTIACGVIVARETSHMTEHLVPGVCQCIREAEKDPRLLNAGIWILTTVWEVFAFCLSVWIAAKHFRELQRPLTGWNIGNRFTMLIKTHVFYFAA